MSEAVSLLEEEVLGKAYDARLIRRLLGYLGPYRLRAAGAIGLIVLSSLLELVGPLATAVALDLFIQPLGGETRLSAVSSWLSERLAASGVELEPMTGLDPKARILVKRFLQSLKAEGHTLFFSTHMLADVAELCDRMGILHEGRLRFVGAPGACCEAFGTQNLEQAYLNCIGADSQVS